MARQGRAGQARCGRYGQARQVGASSDRAGTVWVVEAWRGEVRHVSEIHMERNGEAGMVRQGKSLRGRDGVSRQASSGPTGIGGTSLGGVRFGKVGKAGMETTLTRGDTMKKAYEWRPGFNWKADPNKAGERLEKIKEDNGGLLTPHVVVADAKKKSSPLHEDFEWNDKAAADKYRLVTARNLTASLVIQVVHEEVSDKTPVRAFVHVSTGDGPAYVNLETAMDTDEMRQQLLSRALKELQRLQREYEQLEELAGVFAEVERLNALPKAA